MFADPDVLQFELDTLLIACEQAARESPTGAHQYIYGYLLAFTKDYEQAVPWLQTAAANGHSPAQRGFFNEALCSG